MDYDVVITGSGFGGSIAANRLASAGLKVLVLERGPWRDTVPVRSMGIEKRSPLPYGMRFLTHFLRSIRFGKGTDAQEGARHGILELLADSGVDVLKGIKLVSRDPRQGVTLNNAGFFEAFRYPGIDVLAVSGVGGGSHGWAGILAEPADSTYWQNRHPQLEADAIEKCYDKVRADMQAVRLTRQHTVTGTIWAELEEIGTRCRPLEEQPYVAYKYPQAVSDTGRIDVDEHRVERQVGRLHGDFFLGSQGGARASVDFIYLAPVLGKGATIHDMCEVQNVVRVSGNEVPRFEVRYTDLRGKKSEMIEARRVILAAGTMNTFRLLAISSRLENGLRPMPQLGQTFGGNGDFVGVWHKGSDRPNVFETPPLLGRFTADAKDAPFIGMIGYCGVDTLPLTRRVKRAIAKTVLVLAMGADTGEATAKLVDDCVEIDYDPESQTILGDIKAAFEALAEDSGKPVTPISKPITVHQWGVARLGSSPDLGVVDHNGEVYGNPGLFITDASALSAAPGVPPALSISAWAHHVADRLADRLT